jgi:hypothetical protein
MQVIGHLHATAALPTADELLVLIYKLLGGPRGWCEC